MDTPLGITIMCDGDSATRNPIISAARVVWTIEEIQEMYETWCEAAGE